MNNIRSIENLIEEEMKHGIFGGVTKGSWHEKYQDSAWIYLGGFSFELTEGDLICVLSQWGEVEDIHLVREKETNKSKGFAFVKYEDQRSTILAVDNFNGIKLLGRVLRCDHVEQYRLPKDIREKEEQAFEENPDTVISLAPGHAYEGKQLASEYDINKGVNLWDKNAAASMSSSKPGEKAKEVNNEEEQQEEDEAKKKKDKKEKKKKSHKEKKEKKEKKHKPEAIESKEDSTRKHEGSDESSGSESEHEKAPLKGMKEKDDKRRERVRDGRYRSDDDSRSSSRDHRKYSSRSRRDSRSRSRSRGDRTRGDSRNRNGRGYSRDRQDSRDRHRKRSSRDESEDRRHKRTKSDNNEEQVVKEVPTKAFNPSDPLAPQGAVLSWRGKRDPELIKQKLAALNEPKKPVVSSSISEKYTEKKRDELSGIGGFKRVR